jgi:hypothetical protein
MPLGEVTCLTFVQPHALDLKTVSSIANCSFDLRQKN